MRRKIVVSLISLFAIFSLGAIFASCYVASATEQLRTLVELHEIEGLRRHLVISLQTVQGDLYTARTPLARRLDAIVANVEHLDTAAEECVSCHHRPALAGRLQQVRDLIEEYKAALSVYITASANRDRIGRIELEAARIGDQILERTEEMSATASARLAEIADRAATRINRVRIILLVTLAVTIGLGSVVSSYLVRAVTRPIQRLVGATRTIASGNLGHRVRNEGETEFGELARHFNAMSAALEKSYESLRSTNVDLHREISERKQVEQAREELQEQLVQARKMEALGTLSVGIAHEFGNFLQVIQGCVERLEAKAYERGTGRRELDLIGDAAQRATDLTRRLLTFGSKVDSKLLPIDLNQSVRHAKTILERTLPETIEIELSLAGDILSAAADAAQIQQVLLNLGLNARDAMPSGGLFRIETRRGDKDESLAGTAGAAESGEWIVLRVSDTGSGMDEETVRHIFDPFFTTKNVGVGTGLGLATVYGIVIGHGGRITCKSKPGRGTVFEIRLPGVPGDSVTVERFETPTKKTGRGNETILWVDDEAAMLELMRDNLEERGYVVLTADSGEKALELFRKHRGGVDLVILDLGMPGMGGRECLEKLLEIDAGTRVIITTGFGTRSEEQEMTRAGARGFLAKPAKMSEILRKIEEVVNA
jgi:signal transduction histidine kinase/CheY-like chemotaxis protein